MGASWTVPLIASETSSPSYYTAFTHASPGVTMLTASETTECNTTSVRTLVLSHAADSDGRPHSHFALPPFPVAVEAPVDNASHPDCRQPLNVSSAVDGAEAPTDVVLDSEPLMWYSSLRPGWVCWELLPEGSVKTSVFHMTNATLGAGIVCLPYAYLNLGLIFGILATVLFAGLSLTSTKFLVHSLNSSGTTSFEAMALRAGGPFFAFFVQLVIVLFNFGAAVGYLICVGDVFDVLVHAYELRTMVPHVLGWMLHRQVFLTLVAVLFLLPASAVNRLSSLRMASFVGLLGLELVVIATLILAIRQGMSPDIVIMGSPGLFPVSVGRALRGLPLLLFAFACQSNAPAIYHELQGPTYRRMAKVANRAVIMAFITYIVMGVAGFALFGGRALPNILENFTQQLRESTLLLVAFCGIIIGLLLSYPMNLAPCRNAVELFFFSENDATTTKKLIIAITLVIMSLIFSLAFPSVALLFSLMGSTCGSCIAMIFPGVFYLKLVTADSFTVQQPLQVRKGWILIGMGLGIACIGTLISIQELRLFSP